MARPKGTKAPYAKQDDGTYIRKVRRISCDSQYPSLGIVIPAEYLEAMGINKGDDLTIKYVDNILRVWKA